MIFTGLLDANCNVKRVHIVSVGSVDGVCTAAAVMRAIKTTDIGLEFTQAFMVNKIDPVCWESNRQVIFVDLAVNNKDPEMTKDLIRRIFGAGHEIVGIVDEHDAEAWKDALGEERFDKLIVKPVSQNSGDVKSSGALFKSYWDAEWQMVEYCEGSSYSDIYNDDHFFDLCEAADAGDRMDFSTHFGGLVNQAVKSAIWDNSRRIYLAKHFAENREPDEKIHGWVAEYEAILENHKGILGSKQDLDDGIVRITTTGKTVDITTLMSGLYRSGTKVVVCEGMMFDARVEKPTLQVSFGTGEKWLDLMTAIKTVVNPLGGFASKVNVELADEAKALKAVQKLIISQTKARLGE